jgi:hypothetical protein
MRRILTFLARHHVRPSKRFAALALEAEVLADDVVVRVHKVHQSHAVEDFLVFLELHHCRTHVIN